MDTNTHNPLADAVTEDQEKTYVRTTALLAGINAPGFYTVVADEHGRLSVESFTAASVLEEDTPEDKPGVWVASHVNPDSWEVQADSIHEDEVDAWRSLDMTGSHPRVTFVEFGAPVERIVKETHGL